MIPLATQTLANAPGSSVGSSWFAEQFSKFTPSDIALVLLFALATSAIIALVYKKTYRGVMYNPSFSITLILLTMVTSSVVMAIGSNVALSMGMVGALSIVRFRTAVKDPIDTAYMFFAITMGILIGSRYYLPATVVVFGISFVMLLISFLRLRTTGNYLLVIHCEDGVNSTVALELDAELRRSAPHHRVRSKTVTRARNGSGNVSVEMTVELQLKNTASIVSNILAINGVNDATLVSCQSESAF